MFTVTWFTSQHTSNPTFEPTLSLEGDLGRPEVRLVVPHNLVLVAKVLGVALAVGLDVLAVSIGVGVMQLCSRCEVAAGLRIRLFGTSRCKSSAMNSAQAQERCWARLPPTSDWPCSQRSVA